MHCWTFRWAVPVPVPQWPVQHPGRFCSRRAAAKPAAAAQRAGRERRRTPGLARRRQLNRHRRTRSQRAVQLHRPTVGSDQPVHHGQPKPHAATAPAGDEQVRRAAVERAAVARAITEPRVAVRDLALRRGRARREQRLQEAVFDHVDPLRVPFAPWTILAFQRQRRGPIGPREFG